MAAIEVEVQIHGLEALQQISKIVQEIRQSVNTMGTDVKKSVEGGLNGLPAVGKKAGNATGNNFKNSFLGQIRQAQNQTNQILSIAGFSFAGGLASGIGSAIGGVLADLASDGTATQFGSVVGGVIGAAIGKALDIVYSEIKEAFGTIAEVQDTKFAYELALGNKKGDKAYEDVASLPFNTKFVPQDLAQAFLPLIRATGGKHGLTPNQIDNLENSALVAARLSGTNTLGGVEGIGRQFAAIKENGRLNQRQLKALGIPEQDAEDFYEKLGKTLGVSAKEAKKLAQDGQHANDILEQLSKTIFELADRKAQGDIGKNFTTLGDAYNNVITLPRRLFAKLGGGSELTKSLEQLYGTFFTKKNGKDELTKQGEEIFKTLDKMIGDIITGIGHFIIGLTPEALTKATKGLIEFTDELVKLVDWLASHLPGFKSPDNEKSYYQRAKDFVGEHKAPFVAAGAGIGATAISLGALPATIVAGVAYGGTKLVQAQHDENKRLRQEQAIQITNSPTINFNGVTAPTPEEVNKAIKDANEDFLTKMRESNYQGGFY